MSAPVADEGWLTRRNALALLFLALTVLALAACGYMLSPFLPGLSWGFALAVLTHPIYLRFARVLGDNSRAALANTMLVAIMLLLPTWFVCDRVLSEVTQAARWVTDDRELDAWEKKMERHPRVAPILRWVGVRLDVRALGQKVLERVGNGATGILYNGMWVFGQSILTLITLFYLQRDRDPMMAGVRQMVPFSFDELDEFVDRVRSTIHASVVGSISMATLQGSLGGLAFWGVGLPGPLLWGVVMGLFSLIPSLGAWCVWIPAATYLAATDQWGQAMFLCLWGFWVVGSIDNILYPIVVGRELQLHPLLVLLFVVGGVMAFGIAGLIVGPLTLALTDALIHVWRRRTRFGLGAEEAVAG